MYISKTALIIGGIFLLLLILYFTLQWYDYSYYPQSERKIVLEKAREIAIRDGFDPNNKKVDFRKRGNDCIVEFSAMPRNGKLPMGGGYVIVIDARHHTLIYCKYNL